MSEITTPIVAVIGAGPAGIYATKQLVADGCQVVLFNRDIKPGGLAEYGIYPDKHRMKEGLRAQFRSILCSPMVHYFGHVSVGKQGEITLEKIRSLGFHAVLAAVGAQAAKEVGIPGENLRGVYHAKEVVYHYNRLPPYSQMTFNIGKRVAVVGVGNVMLDIARWLIDDKNVSEVIAFARRGPAEVKFDRKELELVVSQIEPDTLKAEVERVSQVMRSVDQDPDAALVIYDEARLKTTPLESRSRMVLQFLSSPKRIIPGPDGGVAGLEVEETTLVRSGDEVKAVGTGVLKTIAVDTVIFAIGDAIDSQLGLPVIGNQFLKNPGSKFLVDGESYESCSSQDGEGSCGVFVAGWARRASSGVVGIARKDGVNAATAIHQYLTSGIPLRPLDVNDLTRTIREILPGSVEYPDILRLEEAERKRAVDLCLEEFKFSSNEEMFKIIGKQD